MAVAPAGAPVAIPVATAEAATRTRDAEPLDIDDARRRKAGGIGRLGMWAATVAAGIAIALIATQLLIVGPQNSRSRTSSRR